MGRGSTKQGRARRRLAVVVVAVAASLAAACGEFTVPNLTPAEITAPPRQEASTGDGQLQSSTVEPATPSTVVVVPEEPAVPPPQNTEEWRVALAAAATELPGGGTEVFPNRRLVANYGSPATSLLGVLGERSFRGNVEELQALAEQYRVPTAEGAVPVPVQPSLEIIVSVATAEAGGDGDYSKYLAKYRVRRWVDAAAEAGVFVILDLQPGRTDFVTQAKWFEEFLRQPHVGLALDPEWRIGPDEVHLRRIGSVSAVEVNEVVDYLVGLVHEEVLPQKMLVLHQFKRSMLPDRELIRTPPELAVVVHVDGQGPLGSKYGTWDDMLDQPIGPEQTLWWGWKNFYDEDTPVATPGQVNQVEPLPVLITYQ